MIIQKIKQPKGARNRTSPNRSSRIAWISRYFIILLNLKRLNFALFKDLRLYYNTYYINLSKKVKLYSF